MTTTVTGTELALRRAERWLVPTLLSVWALALTWLFPTVINDWHFHVDGGHALISGHGLNVYSDHPNIQIGPLSLFAAWIVDSVAGSTGSGLMRVTIAAAFGPLAMWAIHLGGAENSRARSRATSLVMWGWAAVAALGWAALANARHLDDALAVGFILATFAAGLARRTVWSGVWMGLAVWAKPWAIATLPALAINGARWRRALIAAAIVVAPLALFVILDPGSLSTSQVAFALDDGSALRLFVDQAPPWIRLVQLGAALVVGLAVAWRAPLVAPFAVIAVRLLLEPGVWAYYYGPFMLMALLADASWRRSWPILTPVVMLAWLDPFETPASRALQLLIPLIVAFVLVAREPSVRVNARWSAR